MKSRVLKENEINVLFVKAKRFLSKDSVKKEKAKIKDGAKQQFITGGKGQGIFMKEGELVFDSDDEIIEQKNPKKVGAADNDSDFEDVSSSDEEEEKKQKPVNKRNAKEDPRNRLYLQHYRETVELEQSERYFDIRSSHTVDFTSPKGRKKLLEIEGIVRMVYKEQCVTREDLQLRDKVIMNIKNAFKNCSDRDYP